MWHIIRPLHALFWVYISMNSAHGLLFHPSTVFFWLIKKLCLAKKTRSFSYEILRWATTILFFYSKFFLFLKTKCKTAFSLIIFNIISFQPIFSPLRAEYVFGSHLWISYIWIISSHCVICKFDTSSVSLLK